MRCTCPTLQAGAERAVVELGGAVIYGDSNPLAVLARQQGLPLHLIKDDDNAVPIYDREAQGGGEVEVDKELDKKVGLRQGGRWKKNWIRRWGCLPSWVGVHYTVR